MLQGEGLPFSFIFFEPKNKLNSAPQLRVSPDGQTLGASAVRVRLATLTLTDWLSRQTQNMSDTLTEHLMPKYIVKV